MKINLSITFLLIVSNIFSQTFRDGFDSYETGAGGAYGQGNSFHSNVKGELNFGEAYFLF